MSTVKKETEPELSNLMDQTSLKTDVQNVIFKCSQHANIMFTGLSTLLASNQMTDVVLIAGNDKLRVMAHRLILSALSEYFSAMFNGSLREATDAEVILHEVRGVDLQKLVQFCYTGSIELHEDTVETLLAAANMLRFDTVVNACSDYLANNLRPSNCLGISFIANQFNRQKLLKESDDFTCIRFADVCKNEEFLQLSVEELRKTLSNDDIQVVTEEVVFNALMTWINHDKVKREKLLPELLDTVRIGKLSPTFILNHVEPVCKTASCKQLLLEAFKLQMLPSYNSDLLNNKPRNVRFQLVGVFMENQLVELHSYCSKTNKWTINTVPVPITTKFGIGVLDKNVIFLGGILKNIAQNLVYSIHFKTMACTKYNPMMHCCYNPGVTVLNGMMYVAGGLDKAGQRSRLVQRLNPATTTWDCVSTMKSCRTRFKLAALCCRLYAIGGMDSDELNSVESYDPHTNIWTYCAPMIFKRVDHCVAVANGCLYAIGGLCDRETNNTAEKYDPVTNMWSLISSPTIPIENGKASTLGDRIIVADATGVVQEYDPIENVWTSLESIISSSTFYDLVTVDV